MNNMYIASTGLNIVIINVWYGIKLVGYIGVI